MNQQHHNDATVPENKGVTLVDTENVVPQVRLTL